MRREGLLRQNASAPFPFYESIQVAKSVCNQPCENYACQDLRRIPSASWSDFDIAQDQHQSETNLAFVHVATWNIVAPNNNPFEFWSKQTDKNYDDLMMGVHTCIDDSEGLSN